MMKLTTMVRGLAGDKAARELIRNWEFDEGTLKFWRASSNFVYMFNRDGERYFLRFNFEEENTAQQLAAELEFMQYLLKHEYPCVVPISSVNGKWIETIQVPEGSITASCSAPPEGLHSMALLRVPVQGLGKSLARLHTLSSRYEPGAVRRRSVEDILRLIDQVLRRHPGEQDAMDELHRISLWLQFLPASRQTYGLIHYDFMLDNIF